MLGVLSENYVNLEPAQKGVVRRFIQKIIDLIGIDMDIAGKADADVIDLLNTVSGKVARGYGRVLEWFGEVLGGPGGVRGRSNPRPAADFRSLKR